MLTSAFGRLRQEDCQKFEESLWHIVSYSPACSKSQTLFHQIPLPALPEKSTPVIIQYLMVSPENMHISNFIQIV